MPRIKSYSLDHYYVGRGHRGISVQHKDLDMVFEYNIHPRKFGKTLTITTLDSDNSPIGSVVIKLNGKNLNAIKRMIEVAEKEMVKD